MRVFRHSVLILLIYFFFVSGIFISAVAAAPITLKNRVDPSQIPLADAIIMGNSGAHYRFILFQDPECTYCQKMHREIRKVTDTTSDIAFFVKMYPLPMHKKAYEKSKSIICEKSLALLEDAFEKKQIPPAKCETSAVDDNISIAKKIGIIGVPALILPDGRVVMGLQNFDAILSLAGFKFEKVDDLLNFTKRRNDARKKFSQFLLQQPNSEDETALVRAVQTGSIEAYRLFTDKYPNSKYVTEVKNYINWYKNTKVAISANIKGDNSTAQNHELIELIKKMNAPYIYTPNILESKDIEGALVFLTSQSYKVPAITADRSDLYMGVGAGAGIGSVFGPVGTVVGGVAGVLYDALVDAIFAVKPHGGRDAIEWAALITYNSQREVGIKYRRAYFSDSIKSALSDERFHKYVNEALLLLWLSQNQTSVSDAYYNIILKSGDDTFACDAMNISERFKKVLSTAELADFCQTSLVKDPPALDK
jgi:hypothetical protein